MAALDLAVRRMENCGDGGAGRWFTRWSRRGEYRSFPPLSLYVMLVVVILMVTVMVWLMVVGVVVGQTGLRRQEHEGRGGGHDAGEGRQGSTRRKTGGISGDWWLGTGRKRLGRRREMMVRLWW